MTPQEHSLRVKFSSHFVRRFSESLKQLAPGGLITGLLFGATVGPADAIVQSCRILPGNSPETDRHLAFEKWQRESANDREIVWLDLLGWFCVRPESAGELLPSDVAFHNTYFPAPGKLAVIFHSVGDDMIAAEMYTNSADSLLHIDKHHRVSLRLTFGPNGGDPTVRPKLNDQTFLRAYEIAGALDREERLAEWKARIHRLTHFEWLRR